MTKGAIKGRPSRYNLTNQKDTLNDQMKSIIFALAATATLGAQLKTETKVEAAAQ